MTETRLNALKHMRVLVIGASGLIGSSVTVRLIHEDCDVVAVARRTGNQLRRIPAAHWIALDIATVRRPEDWLPHLDGVDAVVNCAGVLQDSPRDSTRGVHVEGVSALFAACAQIGVRRVVHFPRSARTTKPQPRFRARSWKGIELLCTSISIG